MVTPRELGAVGSLALALFHHWEPNRLFVIINVYMDESGTHGGAPLMVMAGYVAKLGQWRDFDELWRRILKKRGLTYFHAKEVWHGENDWKGWSFERKAELADKVTRLCQKRTLFGFSVRLSHDDYKKFYLSGDRPRKTPIDSKYGVCFRICLGFVVEMTAVSLEREDLELNFILEEGHNNSPDAQRIFAQIRQANIPEISPYLGAFSVLQKKKAFGLQAADSLAYAAYKLEQKNPELTAPIQDGLTAQQGGRIIGVKSPSFRLDANEDVLVQMRNNLFALAEIRKQYGQRRSIQKNGNPLSAEGVSEDQSS